MRIIPLPIKHRSDHPALGAERAPCAPRKAHPVRKLSTAAAEAPVSLGGPRAINPVVSQGIEPAGSSFTIRPVFFSLAFRAVERAALACARGAQNLTPVG